MRWLWRMVVVLGIFVGIGFATMHVVVDRAMARGTPEYSVRLGGAMAGLFVGGAAAALVSIGLFLMRTRADSRQG